MSSSPNPNLERLQRLPSMQVHAEMGRREEERERQQVERVADRIAETQKSKIVLISWEY
jgi:hypothetical protein